MLLRDCRSKEIRILIAAVLCAVTCLTAISFSLDSISKRLRMTSAEMLGADLNLVSRDEISSDILQIIEDSKLQSSSTINFYTMLSNQDDLLLAEIKAVDSFYPLKGMLKISESEDSIDSEIKHPPNVGEIWLDNKAFMQLGSKIGDTINVGEAKLKLTAILTFEPDKLAGGFAYAPRAMINIEDVENTQSIIQGSRVTYKILIAGDNNDIATLVEKINNLHNPNITLQTIDTEVGNNKNLELTAKYISIALILNIILAIITVTVIASRYNATHAQEVAILRCLGADRRQIIKIYLSSLLFGSVLLSIIGSALGYGIYVLAAQLLFKHFQLLMPAPGIWPLWLGFACCIIIILIFGLSTILTLTKVSPIYIFHRSALFDNKSWRLHFNLSEIHPLVKLCINNISYNFKQNLILIISFATVVCMAMILFIVRADLIKTWLSTIPDNTPNYFAINIPKSSIEKYHDFFRVHNIYSSTIYPIIRGRLVKINGTEVSIEATDGKRTGINRPLNLTWAETIPSQNEIVAGLWFDPASQSAEISIERELAIRLNVELNDTMTFVVLEQEITATVTSIRTVNWNTFTPNFYIIYSPNILNNFPATYMNSFYLGDSENNVLLELVKTFPQINIINVAAMLEQFKAIVSLISLVISFIWFFTLAISILLLLAVLNASLDWRIYQNNLMRIFGASKTQLLLVASIEFCILGTIAGLMGSTVALLSAKIIALNYLELYYPLNWQAFFYGVIMCVSVMLIFAISAINRALNLPPLQLNRKLN